jgi:hypothetical protein
MNRAALTPIALGWLLGSLVGLTEALFAWTADPAWGTAVLGWGAVLDGLVGALIAAGIHALRPSRSIAAASSGVVRAVWITSPLVTLGALAAATSGPPAGPGQPFPMSAARVPDVVWIAIDGLRERDLPAPAGPIDGALAYGDDDRTALPAIERLMASSVRFTQVWSTSDDPATALAAELTGRLPPATEARTGTRLHADTVTSATHLTAEGVETTAILPDRADLAAGFADRTLVTPRGLLGADPASSRLLLLRAAAWAFGAPGPQPSAPQVVAQAAADHIAAWSTAPQTTFVWLAAPDVDPAADPAEAHRAHLQAADAAVDQLLTALDATPRGRTALILLHGTAGAATAPAASSDAADTLRPDLTHVATLVRLPASRLAGTVTSQITRGDDLGASVVSWQVGAPTAELFDGQSRFARLGQPGSQRDPVPADLRLDPPPDAVPPPPPPPDVGPAPDAPKVKPPPDAPPSATPPPPTDAGEGSHTPPVVRGPKPTAPDAEPDPAPTRPPPAAPARSAPAMSICDALGPDLSRTVAVARHDPQGAEEAETAWVIRHQGYALHLDGPDLTLDGAWRLYDALVDPAEQGRPVARDALTCGDVTAADRAVRMVEAARTLWQASADRPEPIVRTREMDGDPSTWKPPTMPDPRAILQRAGKAPAAPAPTP